MKRNLRLLCVLLCGALLLPLYGCTGRELYERLLIHGIGVDADREGFLVTVRSSAGADEEELFTATGATVAEALNSLARTTGRKPFYAHNTMVVFGRGCAQRGLADCTEFFTRSYDTRPAVKLYLAQTTAEEVLSYQQNGAYVRMAELARLSESGSETGDVVQTELLDFYNEMQQTGVSVLPVLKLTSQGVEVSGTAVFADFTLQGTLTGEQTTGLLAVRGQLHRGVVSVSVGGGEEALALRRCRAKLSLLPGGEAPQFLLELRVTAAMAAEQPESDRHAAALATALETHLRHQVSSALHTALSEYGCDVFGLGQLVSRSDPARWAALAPNWSETVKKCEITLAVTAKIE